MHPVRVPVLLQEAMHAPPHFAPVALVVGGDHAEAGNIPHDSIAVPCVEAGEDVLVASMLLQPLCVAE